jgi:hypothetical protein
MGLRGHPTALAAIAWNGARALAEAARDRVWHRGSLSGDQRDGLYLDAARRGCTHMQQQISPTASAPRNFGDMLTDIVPVLATVWVAGPPVLVAWAGTVLLALMLAGPFALLVTLIVVLIAAGALVALAGAILATPYLLIRQLRGHRVRRTTRYREPQLVAIKSQRATT